MIEIDTINLGDCLEIMKDIPDNSVDMVLCDLPYGVLNKTNKSAQWDNIIPFEPLWKEYGRICKDKANIVLFAQGMFTAKLLTSNPKWWRYNLVWSKEYVTGFLDANRKPLPCHEDICVFTNGGGYGKTYNPQMTKVAPHLRNHNRRGGNHNRTQSCYGKLKDMPPQKSDELFPRTILSFPKDDGTRHYHPTTKPIDLLRYLILTYSNEGEVILDNTMGSGSTCVAALIEKRHYIGIEIEQKYYDIANKRIEQQKQQLTLF